MKAWLVMVWRAVCVVARLREEVKGLLDEVQEHKEAAEMLEKGWEATVAGLREQLNCMWDCEKARRDRLERIAKMGPMEKEKILNGLARGADDPAVVALLAIVKGLREIAVRGLENSQTSQETATLLRGKLAMASEVEQLVGDCWGAIERMRKIEEANEKK